MNIEKYNQIKEKIKNIIKNMTKIEKIEWLEDGLWQVNMIDRWQENDRIRYDVLTDLLKEVNMSLEEIE